VLVATDSAEVAEGVRSFGGNVELTRSNHVTGTDRVAEAAERYPELDVIANVQADQPFVTPEMLEQLVAPYTRGESPAMTTLACPLADQERAADPNVVKVVCDRRGRALYFSRSPIPYCLEEDAPALLHHLGLYAFRADALRAYTELAPTPLERCERLEQLRALEHGFEIAVCLTETAVLEVNTVEDSLRAQDTLLERGLA
jgi:3-deoxy-manno-octulosonate cytidylyltransferase (CMP-KDO synthetase)